MVHFIGKSKPWMEGRQALTGGSSGGVYKELLGKWWSTYDRYYRIAVGSGNVFTCAPSDTRQPSSALGQSVPGIRTVQQYVKGEQTQSASGWAATGQLPGDQPPPPTPSDHPAIPAPSSYLPSDEPDTSLELPLTESSDKAEDLEKGLIEPTPTSEQRKYSAPFNDWDATR